MLISSHKEVMLQPISCLNANFHTADFFFFDEVVGGWENTEFVAYGWTVNCNGSHNHKSMIHM